MTMLKHAVYAAAFVATSFAGLSAVNAFASIRSVFSVSETTAAIEQMPTEPPQQFESILPPAAATLGREDDFDPSGYYEIWSERSAKSFDKDLSFEFAIRVYKGENNSHLNKPIVPSGSVFAEKDLLIEKIAYGSREIAFETATIGGVSYKFVGHFPVAPQANCENCEPPSDLKGTLTKMKNGKVVATGEVEFYLGGC